MDKQTRDLVATLAPALAPLGRTIFQQRIQRKQMEEKAEIEKELIETRAQAEGDAAISLSETTERTVTAFEETVEEMKLEESCDTCKMILDSLTELPEAQQGRALAEFGRFKQALEGGATEDELRDLLQQHPTLLRAFRSKFDVDV